MWRLMSALVAALFLMLAACSAGVDEASAPRFFEEEDPQLLSDWGQLSWRDDALTLSDGVVAYDLNSALFTDYALKLRTIWMPDGAGLGSFAADGMPNLPVGTVITKTFYYPKAEGAAVLKVSDTAGQMNPILNDLANVRLMETRILVHRSAGWKALSYVWSEDQSDAKLTRIGAIIPLQLVNDSGAQDFPYIVPNQNQCAGCHAPNNTTREIAPIGIRPRHLNKDFVHAGEAVNQLAHLQGLAYIEGQDFGAWPVNVDWTDSDVPQDARARSYLDINCSHCHNPVGPADTSGLDLTVHANAGIPLGVCKLPIAAGSGTGGRPVGIHPGNPEKSIMVYRMESTDPGAMMPELGRSLAHIEGIGLIGDWIADMDRAC